MKLLNKLFLKAHAIRTSAEDPLQKYMFRVTIPGLPTSIGFQKVSGLSQELEVIEYDEGQWINTHKLPGRQKVGEIVCERGEFSDKAFQDLVKKTLTSPNFRNTVIVEKLERFGTTGRTYKLAEAWVSKWEGSEMDATSSEASIEKITIQFEYFLD